MQHAITRMLPIAVYTRIKVLKHIFRYMYTMLMLPLKIIMLMLRPTTNAKRRWRGANDF